MGRDKAALIVDGEPLWKHQLDTLAATRPAELFVAGKCAAIPADNTPMIPDEWPDCGPLGGIATALAHACEPWVLVLAVDMPAMTPAFLFSLLEEVARTGRGAVPMLGARWEPLAAIYPVAALPIARELLGEGRLALATFIEAVREAGLLGAVVVDEGNRALFENLNTPEDWARRSI